MAAAAYRHLYRDLDVPELLVQADLIRETMATPGWRLVADAIAEHEQKMLAQLLHETTKAEEIPRLRGLVNGLRSMREAADSIIALAEERLSVAQRESARAQEHAHA